MRKALLLLVVLFGFGMAQEWRAADTAIETLRGAINGRFGTSAYTTAGYVPSVGVVIVGWVEQYRYADFEGAPEGITAVVTAMSGLFTMLEPGEVIAVSLRLMGNQTSPERKVWRYRYMLRLEPSGEPEAWLIDEQQ